MSEPVSACRGARVTLLEVSLDVCSNVFGEAPCTATGEPCYQTWATCKDQCNFNCTTKSFWFSDCELPPHLAQSYTANINSVSSNPTTLSIGTTFSTRGRIVIEFQDAPHNDIGFDPYHADRHVIPIRCAEDMPGTLWGRLTQRVKFWENRRATVYHGYCDQPLCDFTKEAYFIDSVDGPSAGGTVTMNLKDPLILADDKAAKCPRAESLKVATTVIGNEFEFPMRLGTALDGLPSGAGATDNPFTEVGAYLLENNYLAGDPDQDLAIVQTQHVCIGNEVMRVRPEINNATPQGWNLVLMERGACGSEIRAHDVNATITRAETFSDMHVADVVLRLLTECATIEDVAIACCTDEQPNLIDFDSFESYRCANPLARICETVICKPVGVTTLLNELSEQFLFFLFYDSATGKIRMQGLAPVCEADVFTIKECWHVVKDSFSTKRGDGPYNQITYLHDTINCAQGLSDSNLSSATVTVTADALKEPCDRREYKSRREKEIKSRWIGPCNTFLARANGERWLRLRRCRVESVTIDVTFDVGKCIEYGGFARIEHDRLQSASGGPREQLFMLTGKHNVKDCTRLTFEQSPFDGTVAPCFGCDEPCATVAVLEDECANDDCVGVW